MPQFDANFPIHTSQPTLDAHQRLELRPISIERLLALDLLVLGGFI